MAGFGFAAQHATASIRFRSCRDPFHAETSCGLPRWSRGQTVPAAVLFQREVVTSADPGFVIDGVHVDVDDVLAADYGQWELPRP